MHNGSSESDRDRQEFKVRQKKKKGENLRGQGARQLMGLRFSERLSPIRRITFSDKNGNIDVRFFFATLNVRGHFRLLSGMVLANRPWTIFPSFKRVVAVAFATGAYGLIFPTLWVLSSYFGLPRFLALMVTAMGAMVMWIIVAHSLWEKPSQTDSPYLVRLYNTTTVLTLFYYVLLFILFLLVVVIFVPVSLLQANIESPVNLLHYIRLAWLACSLATLAGALGAGLESEETVLKATYGYLQRLRNENT
ncbi:hypothetical protein ACE1TI_15915 [Alteribacillus sp. JSM 102045]|uniref:hypothetical protein n=1 Tax=Alteribacillus sp. JSM 102045 TaxID=1562101 RepID=UPI0035BFDABD